MTASRERWLDVKPAHTAEETICAASVMALGGPEALVLTSTGAVRDLHLGVTS
jgi:hypothetical protein